MGIAVNPNKVPSLTTKSRVKGKLSLVPVQFNEPHGPPTDFRKIFTLIVGASYCKNIDPPVKDGTIASFSVLGYFSSDKVQLKLLAQVHTPTIYTHDIHPRHTGKDDYEPFNQQEVDL